MVVLERKGNEVFCGGRKLTIVPQATKGPGKEVVKIGGLEGSNGQQWISLSKLNEGINEIETQAKQITTCSYLTQEEKKRIEELESEIREIKERAKLRKPVHKKLEDMTIQELEEFLRIKKGE